MADAKGQIGFQQIGLGEVLKQYRLIVPPNQREYSWRSDKHVVTLLQDIAKAISDEDEEYFLGTIVTIPRAPDVLEVVDGQQRLATTAILLCAIRNYLKSPEPIIAESITNGFLTDIDRTRRERVPKMQLNLDDNEFFRLMISEEGARPTATTVSHQRIREAFQTCERQIRNIVSGFDPKDHGDVLNKWIGLTEHGATVILLKVPSDANAYKMFETLNDRGLKTSQADLVKNYLFGKSGSRLPEAQQKWALMRGALESLDEEDATVTFLRYVLILVSGFVKESEVYEGVQSQANSVQTSLALLSEAESLAGVYVAMFNPEHEKWNEYPASVRRGIQTLNLFDIRPLRPLMLAVAAKFSPQETVEAFKRFIAWGIRLIIVSSTRSGSIEGNFASAATSVFSGQITTASELQTKLLNIIPNDEQFRQAFEVATVSKVKLARYYLRSLEMVAKNEATPWFIPNDDQQVINLEHVLPERPEGNWPQFSDDLARAYVRRLGNQALLLAKANSDLKSAGFPTKKEIYKQTPYILTRQIADFDQWGEEQINERQKQMASLALRAWPL